MRQHCASSGSYKIPSWRGGCEIVIGNSVLYTMFNFHKDEIL